MDFGNFPRVISQAHPVCWAGFQSDTRTLQQNGWEFSANQDMSNLTFGLMMRHQALGIHAATNMTHYGPMEMKHPNALIPFYIQWLTDKSIKFQHIQPPQWALDNECHPVDMQPQVIHEMKDIDDLNLFAGVSLARTKQLIVDPDDVSAMMDRILEVQDPARQERFKKMVQEARQDGSPNRAGPRQEFHAQIVSIAA